MKVIVERSDLLKAMSRAQSIVERRTTIPILSNVLIEAIDGKISLRTTDLDIEIVERVSASVEQDGHTTVGAHTLHDIVRKLPDGASIQLIADQVSSRLEVKAGRSRFSLATLPREDFPIMANSEYDSNFTIAPKVLNRLFEKSKFAMSTEETRYYLNGVYFHVASNAQGRVLRAVATDGHRLAQYDIPLPQGAKDMNGIIIPKKMIQELRRVLDDATGDINIQLNENKIKFSFNNMQIISKVIDGTFPDYTKVIPQSNDKSITTNNEELKKAIDRVSAVAINEETKSKAIKLIIESNKISLSVDSSSRGSAIEEIDLDYNNEKVEIGFNSRYLIDICNEIDGDKINLKFLNSTSPAIILDNTDENLFFVLMPMRI